MGAMTHRPITISVLAAFLFVATAMAVATGTSLLFPNPFWKRLWDLNRPAYADFERFGKTSGVCLLALAVGTAAAGVGLLYRRKWAWWFVIVLFAINGCGDVMNFLARGDLLKSGSGVVIAVAFCSS